MTGLLLLHDMALKSYLCMGRSPAAQQRPQQCPKLRTSYAACWGALEWLCAPRARSSSVSCPVREKTSQHQAMVLSGVLFEQLPPACSTCMIQ